MSPFILKKNLLETWIRKKIGSKPDILTRQQLGEYQLQKIKETIGRASANSPFYRNLLKNFIDMEMSSLTDLQRFPFTTAAHIREQGLQFLCVSQGDICRIVTLDSSGTTGQAKRIYFTASDQELTVDFFQQGMSTMIKPRDRVLILLPGERSGSVGELLVRGLKRAGAEPVLHGVVANIMETLEIIEQEGIDSIVGIPVQLLALARYTEYLGKKISLKSVLLSTDHVPDSIIQELRRIWGCQVFEHYGMTEMGLGGGLDCESHAGYHLREADLYFEIIDEKGQVVPDGQEGEVVFTTLTRQGMPLIRYRTGDISRFLAKPCSCGTMLKRLERITKRKGDLVFLNEDHFFTMADLDEKIFLVPGVLDYTVTVDNLKCVTQVNISVLVLSEPRGDTKLAIYEGLSKVVAIKGAEQIGQVRISVAISYCRDALLPSPVKRRIMELKEADGK
ncbi:DVU_1553 family AMP-dependent CoA ligase [Pelosinus sp. sgz500959]|uniref:DVU_1553 family AMP-dependent CoA ligase n=1 Tax=Pelosinus sp. sgz500959 TaxID=3242472 RepID=UPI0036708793